MSGIVLPLIAEFPRSQPARFFAAVHRGELSHARSLGQSMDVDECRDGLSVRELRRGD